MSSHTYELLKALAAKCGINPTDSARLCVGDDPYSLCSRLTYLTTSGHQRPRGYFH